MSSNPIESDSSSLIAARDETRDLLRGILEELRNIGVRLTKQDERLKSLEKGETRETDEAESTLVSIDVSSQKRYLISNLQKVKRTSDRPPC